ncbi:hypothetical protein Pla52n_26240 [Stieleria varia]|uniref:Uncharacterized protein n=1 Tax=Stieleria varia TaxID=2528005 RepID=A0A5C6AZP1_9BACT|nr:hypothetical protein Pla52n_26240 [Stieleria varia]
MPVAVCSNRKTTQLAPIYICLLGIRLLGTRMVTTATMRVAELTRIMGTSRIMGTTMVLIIDTFIRT